MNLCIRLLVAAASYFVAADATSLTILHVNDHHSHLEVDSASLNIYGDDIPAEVSSNNGGTTYIRAYYGGYPRIVTAFKALESEAVEKGRDVLKLHAGDAITGTTFFTLFKGDADARMMTHVCFDAFAPGNHEVRRPLASNETVDFSTGYLSSSFDSLFWIFFS
jgi:5'-nucleotidase